MRCDEVRENLVAYLDGETSPEERERIESHLAGCPGCREEREGLGSTGDLLGVLARTESAPDLASRVLREAHGETSPSGETHPSRGTWCRHIRRRLVPFLDRELDDVEARPVREHLDECRACRGEARDLERTGARLALWTVEFPQVDLLPRILPGATPARVRILRPGPLAAIAAAVVLSVAGAVLLGLFGGSPSGEEPVKFAERPPRAVLESLEVLDSETLDLLDHDADLLELAEDLDWIDSLSEEELALLAGSGG